MHPRALTRFIATALVAVTFAAASLKADEITDLLKKAGSDYESGNYSEAISSLDYAGQLIRQKKGEGLLKLLPEAQKGWTAEEPTSESTSGAMFGGMVAVERRYQKDDSGVTIKITSDSPMLAGMLGMFSNPMLVSGSGGKMETIKGQKAVVKYDAPNKSGDINIVVGGKILVTIEGHDVSRDVLTGYAGAIDYAKLSAAQ